RPGTIDRVIGYFGRHGYAAYSTTESQERWLQQPNPPPLYAGSYLRWYHIRRDLLRNYTIRDVVDTMIDFRRYARLAGRLSLPVAVHRLHAHVKQLQIYLDASLYLLTPLNAIVI